MSDRSDFKDSIRQLAAQVLEPKESVTVKPSPTRVSSSRPTLVKQADEAGTALPARLSVRKAKRPKALEWLNERKNFKQVSVEIPPELHQMITRASHGQRMNGKFPGNKREIYCVAAVEWLERNGWFVPEELLDDGGDEPAEES